VVKLPCVPGPQAAAECERAAQPASAGERRDLRVLVVDDNPDFVTLLVATLRDRGYAVESATSGPDGLAAARQWRPDAVVLDIGLPGLDGYEVARRLRADARCRARAGGRVRCASREAVQARRARTAA
jgi:CheY-like chemotaxis protein